MSRGFGWIIFHLVDQVIDQRHSSVSLLGEVWYDSLKVSIALSKAFEWENVSNNTIISKWAGSPLTSRMNIAWCIGAETRGSNISVNDHILELPMQVDDHAKNLS